MSTTGHSGARDPEVHLSALRELEVHLGDLREARGRDGASPELIGFIQRSFAREEGSPELP
ncbi:MAG: hypothetical protein ACAI25_16560, partial [Planctomycetota bacterium]